MQRFLRIAVDQLRLAETGAAQHYRDARIAAIYEGTNGIQALDLVTRKLPLDGGKVADALIAELRQTVTELAAVNDPALGASAARLGEALDCTERAARWLLAQGKNDAALAGATPFLRLFASATGGCLLARNALAAIRGADGADPARWIGLTRFFAENVAVQAPSLERIVTESADSLSAAPALLN